MFIYPTFYKTNGGEKYYTGFYPLKPSEVQYMIDAAGNLYLNLRFANGYEITLPSDSVIHWRKDYGVNDYFGGGMFGGDDNSGLLTMLQRYDQLTQSIAKAVKCSCQVNAAVKVNTYAETDELKQKREEFEADIINNKSGLLVMDQSSEFVNIPRDVKLVDADTLKFFTTQFCVLTGAALQYLTAIILRHKRSLLRARTRS